MIIKTGKTKQRDRGKQPIKMLIDLPTFNILCRYILSSPAYLRMSHLSNLNNLISNLDLDNYNNDPEKIKRIEFIKKGLDARLRHNLSNIELIVSHINSNLNFDIDFIDFDNFVLSPDEIKWCHQMVSESIQYAFIYNYTDKLLDVCTRIQSSNYAHRGVIVQEFRALIDELKNEFRKSDTDGSLTDMTFNLVSGELEQVVRDTYNLITNPSRRLITGMQGLNEMIGGGFESGRVYMLFGITGIGKSISLLNIMYQLKIYNKHYKPKDPTKIPTIVMLTMENTVVETITRLFDLVVGSAQGTGMENFTVDEVIDKLKTEGQLTITDESPINIIIKYKANKSIDTSYLYTLCDDLEDQGYEVICLIQDHVKRIRSIWNASDVRIELGDIVNEFKSFAAEKDIPVITNSHLNREAIKIIEEAMNKPTKTDITMKLGKSNVGESTLILDNLDVGIVINIDFDEEENKYMVYNLIKMRDKTQRTYIAQPFAFGSTIRMLEDVGGVPMFKEHLHMNTDVPRIASIRTSSANVMANINNIVTSNIPKDTTFTSDRKNYNLPNPEDEEEIIDIIKPKLISPIYFFDLPKNKPSLDSIEKMKQELQLK